MAILLRRSLVDIPSGLLLVRAYIRPSWFHHRTVIPASSTAASIVESYASKSDLDGQGDIVPVRVIDAALPDFLKFGRVRAMHRDVIGKVLIANVDCDGVFIRAQIHDDRVDYHHTWRAAGQSVQYF